MNTALALIPAQQTKWTVISGAMAGNVRLMSAGGFTIGRSPDNEFVLINDPKCSRKHAAVQWTPRGCEIAAINEANPILVNDEEIQRAVLNDNDVVTLGNTKIQFNLTTGSAHDTIAIAPDQTELAVAGHSPVQVRSYAQPAPAARPKSRGKPKKRANSNRMIIYTALALIVLFFMTATPKKNDKKDALRTEQKIQADIDEANKLEEAANKMPIKRIDDTVTGRQAQENFVRGFRDYRKGQYERSLDSFQACLALDPNHSLCNRYIRLAQRKFSEVVDLNLILGRKYRDQNQFAACRASFRNVMVMVKDANSLKYKEAKANYDACNSLVEGRY
jgi:pSer/pThr/pTyr-binding forkhead associated (FHA) protein